MQELEDDMEKQLSSLHLVLEQKLIELKLIEQRLGVYPSDEAAAGGSTQTTAHVAGVLGQKIDAAIQSSKLLAYKKHRQLFMSCLMWLVDRGAAHGAIKRDENELDEAIARANECLGNASPGLATVFLHLSPKLFISFLFAHKKTRLFIRR